MACRSSSPWCGLRTASREHRVGIELQRVERRRGDARQRLAIDPTSTPRIRRGCCGRVSRVRPALPRMPSLLARRDRLGQDRLPGLRADEPRRQRVGVAELRDVAGQEAAHVLAFRHLGGERLVEPRRRRAPHPLKRRGHAIARIHVDVLGLRDRDLERDPKRSVEHGVAVMLLKSETISSRAP